MTTAREETHHRFTRGRLGTGWIKATFGRLFKAPVSVPYTEIAVSGNYANNITLSGYYREITMSGHYGAIALSGGAP